MSTLSFDRILEYRAATFRLRPGDKLRSKDEAVSFVNERGFVFFWPIKEASLPSLWAAVAGDRPVADAHDDPGHVTWGWKDELLGARRWYYAKVLRKRSTMISLDVLPNFYALSENYGAPEEDYLQQYREGKLSHEAKVIYETLLDQGPLDSPALRTAARMTSRGSDAPFNRALTFLQSDFKVLPIGVAEVGSWNYAFIYELTHRHHPDLAERARPISANAARVRLAELYLASVGAAPKGDFGKMFGWVSADMERAVAALVRSGRALAGLNVEDRKGDWVALAELVA